MGLDHHTYVGPYLKIKHTHHDDDLLTLIEENEAVFDVRGEYGRKDTHYIFGANQDIGRPVLFAEYDSIFSIPITQELIKNELNMLARATVDIVAFCARRDIGCRFEYGIATGVM